MEHSTELSIEAKKHKIDVETLKAAKDMAIKEAWEASMRINATERRAKDAKTTLRGVVEKNFQLLGIQKAQVAEIKELKA